MGISALQNISGNCNDRSLNCWGYYLLISQMICNPSSSFSIFDGLYHLKERRWRTNENGSLEENDHPGSHHSLRFPTRLRFSASDHSLVFCPGYLALGFTKGLHSSQADFIVLWNMMFHGQVYFIRKMRVGSSHVLSKHLPFQPSNKEENSK